MKKLHNRAFSVAMALSQLLPVPFATWAQGQPSLSQAARDGMASRNSGNTDSAAGEPDACLPVPIDASHLPPSLDPPPEWRDKHANLFVNIRQDGSIGNVNLLRPSGDAALDAAAMAQVKQSWRWAPLACGRSSANQQVTVEVPRQNCLASGWTPPPPLTLAQPSRDVSAALDVEVAPDGRMVETRIIESSGDASLDAALQAHVRQNWRFWSLAEGCPNATHHVLFRLPETACIPNPVTESRTPPPVALQGEAPDPAGRTRAVDLQMGVGPDGKLLFANVARSSGDAGLDAAAVAHVKEAWRWQPVSCKRVEVYLRGEPLPVVDFAHFAFPARGAPATN